MIDELDDLLQPWLTHSPSAECTTWTATEWLTRRRWPRLFRSKSTPRNIAICLENTADWDSNFLKLKTPINLDRPILQTIFWIKSENGGKMKCLQRRRSTTCWVRELWSQRTRQRSEPRISSTGETSTSESSIMLKFNNILFGNNCLPDIDTSVVKMIAATNATNAFNRQFFWKPSAINVMCRNWRGKLLESTFPAMSWYLLDCFRMDENNDGSLTEEEFLKGCLQDDELSKMLAPNVAT